MTKQQRARIHFLRAKMSPLQAALEATCLEGTWRPAVCRRVGRIERKIRSLQRKIDAAEWAAMTEGERALARARNAYFCLARQVSPEALGNLSRAVTFAQWAAACDPDTEAAQMAEWSANSLALIAVATPEGPIFYA